MKLKKAFFKIGTIGAFVLLSIITFAQPQYSKEQILISVLLSHIDEYHFSPAEYNNTYSEKIFDLYLKGTDNRKRFLLQSDLNTLNNYKDGLAFKVKNIDLSLYNEMKNIVRERRNDAQGFYKDILAKPFNFKKQESIELDGEKKEYAINKRALKENWRKVLKFQTMNKILDLKETDEHKEKSFNALEKLAREKILKQNNDWFIRLNQETDDDYFSVYLNAITQAIDPHSSFFPPAKKDNFDINMSGKLEGIGARLTQEGAYTKVTSLIPGGPSSKQGELEAEDLILAVGQGNDEAVDVVDMPLDEVVKKIRGKKGTEVRLSVKKIDGSKKIISIIRDVVLIEETYAKSAILEEEGKRLGYIYLPSFYGDCYKDVKNEIAKLEDDNIEGLVFDLRNNTGGYLYEVVKMVGLFIEKGPIVQVKNKEPMPKLHKDYDSEIQFKKPVTVLVNAFSASASEIFAAAIQDYNRGVIIGSESTFGKGTVQKFFDLDRLLRDDYNAYKPLGAVKLTIQKFYRIDGGSTQQKGVVPDIVLPDQYSDIEVGERMKDYVMPWTEIGSVKYDNYQKLVGNINLLKRKSNLRIRNNDVFNEISKEAAWLKNQRDNTFRSLVLSTYEKEEKEIEEQTKAFDDLLKEIKTLTVKNLEVDKSKFEGNEEKEKINSEWLEDLNRDIYILEAINVLQDMFKITKAY